MRKKRDNAPYAPAEQIAHTRNSPFNRAYRVARLDPWPEISNFKNTALRKVLEYSASMTTVIVSSA